MLKNNCDQNQPPSLPRLGFSVNQTAQIMGVSPITVRRLLARGLLKSNSALRTKIIPLSSINQFLEQ
jgi:hypothetical protein